MFDGLQLGRWQDLSPAEARLGGHVAEPDVMLVYSRRGINSYDEIAERVSASTPRDPAGGDGAIRMWDPATGTHTRTLTGRLRWVTAVAYSPDGHTLPPPATTAQSDSGTRRVAMDHHPSPSEHRRPAVRSRLMAGRSLPPTVRRSLCSASSTTDPPCRETPSQAATATAWHAPVLSIDPGEMCPLETADRKQWAPTSQGRPDRHAARHRPR